MCQHKVGIAVGHHHSDRTFAQFNTALDAVQQRFFEAAGGAPDAFAPLIRQVMSKTHEALPNFASYTGAGVQHCILPRNDFYERTTVRVRFRDWVAALAAGEKVPRVECDVCEESSSPPSTAP